MVLNISKSDLTVYWGGRKSGMRAKADIEAANWLELRELVTVERERNIRTLSGRFTGASNLCPLNLAFF